MFTAIRNSDARNALGVLATFNSLFGLWPLEMDNIFLKIRRCVLISVVILQVLLAMYEIKLSCNIVKNAIDNYLVTTFGLVALSKMIYYYKHRDKLRLNVESAIDDWSSKVAKDFRVIMHQSRTTHTTIAHVWVVGGIITCTAYSFKIFFIDRNSMIEVMSRNHDYTKNFTIVTGKRFLFPAACALNNVSEYIHWTIVFAQFIQFGISAGVNLTCDAFFIAITHHLGGQYTILKKKIATFKVFNSETKTRKMFGILITRHAQLLKLSRLLEDSFNMIVLTQMIMNIIIINMAGFNFFLYVKRNELLGIITNIMIVLFALVQTYMYSYIGDDLSNHEMDIILSVYDTPWHRMPKSLTKDMIFVMTRSSFSFHLTAGKFFKMTRSTFADIVKTAASYFSVLRIFINDRDI